MGSFEGLILYRSKKWDQDEQKFRQLQLISPTDGPTRLYLDRIARFRKNPPPLGWQEVTFFDHK